jgi:hypothetical protein
MIQKQNSIRGKNEIKKLLKSSTRISKSMICCSCGDVIRLFTFDYRILTPSHMNSDLTEICDECFYNQNVIKDDDILIYYDEEDIECEKNHHGYSYYIFDYNDVSTNNMVYVNFWIGV